MAKDKKEKEKEKEKDKRKGEEEEEKSKKSKKSKKSHKHSSKHGDSDDDNKGASGSGSGRPQQASSGDKHARDDSDNSDAEAAPSSSQKQSQSQQKQQQQQPKADAKKAKAEASAKEVKKEAAPAAAKKEAAAAAAAAKKDAAKGKESKAAAAPAADKKGADKGKEQQGKPAAGDKAKPNANGKSNDNNNKNGKGKDNNNNNNKSSAEDKGSKGDKDKKRKADEDLSDGNKKAKDDGASSEGKDDGTPRSGPMWWSADDGAILDNVLKVLHAEQKDDTTYKELSWLDWQKVAPANMKPEEAKERWESIASSIPKRRTIAEVVQAAHRRFDGARKTGNVLDPEEFNKRHAKKKAKKAKDPNRPKRPPSSYMVYCETVRNKVREENPDMAITDISKLLGNMWKSLPEKEVKKFNKIAQKKLQEYNEELEKYYAEHPNARLEEFNAKGGKGKFVDHDAPKKPPMNGYTLYVREKGKDKKYLSQKDRQSELAAEWNALPEDEKKTWNEKASENKLKYQAEFEKYWSSLTPEKRELLTAANAGKKLAKIKFVDTEGPEKPPKSGYHLFVQSADLSSEFNDIKSRTQEISRQWKALNDQERKEWNDKADRKKAKYEVEYQEYWKTLSADKKELLTALKASKLKASAEKKRNKPPVKPTAMTVFMKEKTPHVTAKHPTWTTGQIREHLKKEWKGLDEAKRAPFAAKVPAEMIKYHKACVEFSEKHGDAAGAGDDDDDDDHKSTVSSSSDDDVNSSEDESEAPKSKADSDDDDDDDDDEESEESE